MIGGFPSDSAVKNLPANAGNVDLTPDKGGFHWWQPQQLSLCSRAWEPQLLSPHAGITEAHVPYSLYFTREETTVRGLCTPTRE